MRYTSFHSLLFLSLLTTLTGCSGQTTEQKQAEYLELRKQGDTKDDLQDFDGSLKLYLKARDLAPNDPGIHFRIATAAKKLGKKDVGLEAINTMMRLDPKLQKDPPLLLLKQEFEAQPSKVAVTIAKPELTGMARLKYDALVQILQDAQKTPDPANHRQLLYDLLEKSGELLHERNDLVNVWALRAEAAVELNEKSVARDAADKLLTLRADDSEDTQVRQTLVGLERKGLLRKESQPALPPELKALSEKAMNGDASSQAYLGACYVIGKGVETNLVEAARWTRKAAEQGDAVSQSNLGSLYATGDGVNQDYAEAVRWIRKSAEQGHADAQLNLGTSYAQGKGVNQDYVEAVRWFRKAAEQGEKLAQFKLGLCYDLGRGVEESTKIVQLGRAARWYRKAAEQGHVDAQFRLGRLGSLGYVFGGNESVDEGVQWLRKAAEQGHQGAIKLLKEKESKK